MEKYLNTPIKEIITEFSEVGKILEEYNIGCVPCTLGSCLLKDIVVIHNLSPDVENELLYRIEKSIYPSRIIDKPTTIKRDLKPAGLSYSPPIKRLVDEHTLIKKWIGLIPKVLETINISSVRDREFLNDGLDFIRFYADKFHHAKEEDILFEYTDKNLDIIKTILKDHENARSYVRASALAIEKNDCDELKKNLSLYKELLTEHIDKEDKILYPWIDRGLSTTQVGELFSRFDEAEKKIDSKVIEKCIKFISEIDRRITTE